MPKNRRKMRILEESNGASGEVPEYGAIFMSNSSTKKECLKRELFGLPILQAEFVKQVKAGMMLFLFEFESRELHGVFQASSDGAINIEPHAFRSSGKQFPAQVKFTEKWRCRPLRESEFRHAICENYFTATKFNFGLSKAQVQRLLKLFTLKKVERSQQRKSAGAKHTKKSESSLGNTAGGRGFGNHWAGEMDEDDDREIPARVTSVGDLVGCRLTEKYDFGLEDDSPKGETSGVCRRLVDPKMHGSKDIVGYGFSMNNSLQTDALTNHSNHAVVNDRRVPKNTRHTASGWFDNECHEKDGIAEASSWANHKERLNFKPETVVPAQSSVPLESPYRTSKDYYDPCEPGIMGEATMRSSSHYLGAPSVDSTRSACYTGNSDYVLRENVMPDSGGYVCDTLPLETVQPFLDEHNGAIMNKTSSPDLDYYVPMPTEHLDYQNNTGMIGVSGSESEYEPKYGHLRQFQFPSFLTSEGATENMKNFERLSHSSNSIFPSFANYLSSRALCPSDGVDNEISAYQHQEVSYSNDRVVRGSRIYPSFTNPPTSGHRADLYPENRTQNEVQVYQRHEEFGSDALDSKSRVARMEDRVNAVELERKITRKSVFSRLTMHVKEECDVEKDKSPDTETVDDVMAFLNDCHEHWMEQKRSNLSTPEGFGKKKKEKKHLSEALGNDLMLPFSETTPDNDDDLPDCDGSIEPSAQKLPFIDFKRRSKAQKSCGNPTQECKDSPEQHLAPQNKKRKLLRPKLENDSGKDGANNDNPIENVLALQSSSDAVISNR